MIKRHTSERIVIVGGGIAGLSIAARLAQAGLPVTVLEASELGSGASTRNQGWLHSGGWFAPQQLDLAQMCYASLQQTLHFCPGCAEPGTDSMVYLISEEATDPGHWANAWESSNIPYQPLDMTELFERFPGLSIAQARHAFELPDRAMRVDVLLEHLAREAEHAGAEIRANTSVSRLIEDDRGAQGVALESGEIVPARLVVLAGNLRGGGLLPGFGAEAVGAARQVALVVLKTHLTAVQPELSRSPLCVVDADGFNHIPHRNQSVLGTNRWWPSRHGEDETGDADELERLWCDAQRFFPELHRKEQRKIQWAGSTVQPMRLDQLEGGQLPLPMVLDHDHEFAPMGNLVSVFPGRATLWAHLAERATELVLTKVGQRRRTIASPPWGTPDQTALAAPAV